MWFLKLIRSFFFVIDSVLLNFIPTVYSWIITISRTSILNQGQIQDIAGRIQVLLGVFMLFKVSLSIITYIINPDDFSDKSKGFGKLWSNVVIALILLVITPYIFNLAYDFQNKILEDNSLMHLVFGEKDNVSSNFTNSAGQELAFSTLIPFFAPSTANNSTYQKSDISSCSNFITVENNERKFSDQCLLAIFEETNAPDFDFNLIQNAVDAVLHVNPLELFKVKTWNDATTVNNYVMGVERKNLGLTFRLDAVKMTTNGNSSFVINYKPLLSTAAAVIVLLLLITFCMDVALRSVKLAFLQLISPIPIISFIDPKSGKDGLFKKWYQMCFSTYISLFVRLLGLYFAIYLIDIIVNSGPVDVINGESVDDLGIKLLMIIGVLMFAKQLPKILEGFGIKLDGGGKFTLNPFKKFEEEALGGKQILGGAAALGAGALAGVTNFGSRIFDKRNKWRDENGNLTFDNVAKNFGRALGSSVAGTTSAVFRGTGKMLKGEKAGKIFADSYGEAMFSKLIREDNLRKAGLENGSLGERIKFGLGSVGADVARYMGVLNKGQGEYLKADEYAKEIKSYQDKVDDAKRKQSELKKQKFEQLEKAQTIGQNIDTLVEMEKDVKAAKVAWENAKSRGESDATIKSLYDAYKECKGIALNRAYNDNNSVIHQQVELYNSIQRNLSAEQQSIVTHLDTNFTRNVNMDGKFVDTGSGIYSVMNDSSGTYYVDSSGVRHDESSWGAVTRFDVSSSGINNIGDNNDRVTQEKYRFETSGEYARLDADIKNYESKIDDVKNKADYIVVQDENSRAKLQNASRWNTQSQQAGYKPASGPAQGTPHRGLYNPPSGNGGPPPGGGPGPGPGTP